MEAIGGVWLTAERLWRWEGRPYGELAEREGVSGRTVLRHARRLGFSRTSDDLRYTKGPCISCGRVFARDQLGACTCKCRDCRFGGGS